MSSYKSRLPLFLSALFLGWSILLSVGCAATPTRESTGGYVDNSAITLKVKTAIFNDPELKVFQIHVKTYKGTVELSGFVDSQADAERAVEVAKGVPGVVSVRNAMQIKTAD